MCRAPMPRTSPGRTIPLQRLCRRPRATVTADTAVLGAGNDTCRIVWGVVTAEPIVSQFLKIPRFQDTPCWLSTAKNSNDQPPSAGPCSLGLHDTVASGFSSSVSGPFCPDSSGLLESPCSVLLPSPLLFGEPTDRAPAVCAAPCEAPCLCL